MVPFSRFPAILRSASLPAAGLAVAFGIWVSVVMPWWAQFQRNPDEGGNLGKAALVAAGWPPYGQMWNDQPPVLTYILAALQWVFPSDVAAARAVVLVFAALLLFCLYRVVHLSSGHLGGALAVGLLGTSTLFMDLSVSVMIGLPSVAFAVMALDVASAGRARSLAQMAIAGALMGLSLQTKLFTLTAIAPLLWMALVGTAPQLSARLLRATACLGGLAATFLAVALVSGEPIFTQLVGTHLDPALRQAYSLAGSVAAITTELQRQLPLLIGAGTGLLLALWKRPLQLVAPLLWFLIAFISLAGHTPVWNHQVLLLLVPAGWIAGLGWGAIKGNRILDALRLTGAAALVVVSANAGASGAQSAPVSADDPGFAAAASLSRFAGAGKWVASDSPMEVYRAGLLVPPEIVIYSLKRLIERQLDWTDLMVVLEGYRPEQALFRRYPVDDRIRDYLRDNYRPTYDIAGLDHYVRKGAILKDVDDGKLRQALVNMADRLIATNIQGGFAGLTDLASGVRYERATTQKPMPERAITMRPAGSTPRAAQCLMRLASVTGEQRFSEAAVAAAEAVVCAQSRDGGWPAVAPLAPNCATAEPPVRPGAINDKDSLDEGGPAQAISLLLSVRGLGSAEQATRFEASARAALDFLVNAQNADGGWPLKLSAGDYSKYSTLNDGVTTSAMSILARGFGEFSDPRYRQAAFRAVDFLLARQSPAGAWAQQYDSKGQPTAARAFEPAAYASLESARAIIALVDFYTVTRRDDILDAIRRGRDWLLAHELEPQTWSRLYDITTDKPIFGDRDGKVHYRLSEISRERAEGYRWMEQFPEVIRAIRLANAAIVGPDAVAAAKAQQTREESLNALLDNDELLQTLANSAGADAGNDAAGLLSTRKVVETCELAMPALELTGY